MNKPQQYVLDLPHRPALDGEDFWISSCHDHVMRWLDAWPDWPAVGVVICGAPRAGKSHIARMFAQQSGADVISASDLPELGGTAINDGAKALVVEDIDRDPPQESLYHLFNRAKELGVTLLMTSRVLPNAMNLTLKDWQSRLRTFPVAEITRPDDRLMSAVLAKLFHDRQLTVGDAEINYLLTHMERSIASAEAVVAEADRQALALKRRVTVAVLKSALSAISG